MKKPRGKIPAPTERPAPEWWTRRHPAKARAEAELARSHARATKDFAHKVHGTPETHAHAARLRQGSLARLHRSGAITTRQLGAAAEIASVAEALVRQLGVRTVSLETRIDGGQGGSCAFFEALGHVRREIAYTRWRASLAAPAGPVLAMIVEDRGLAATARDWNMHKRRAKALLCDALDRWSDFLREARDEVDEADLLAAQAGILA